LTDHLPALVRRSVVDKNYLELPVLAARNFAQFIPQSPEAGRLIEQRNDDRDGELR
jgi:hypothetical protein